MPMSVRESKERMREIRLAKYEARFETWKEKGRMCPFYTPEEDYDPCASFCGPKHVIDRSKCKKRNPTWWHLVSPDYVWNYNYAFTDEAAAKAYAKYLELRGGNHYNVFEMNI